MKNENVNKFLKKRFIIFGSIIIIFLITALLMCLWCSREYTIEELTKVKLSDISYMKCNHGNEKLNATEDINQLKHIKFKKVFSGNNFGEVVPSYCYYYDINNKLLFSWVSESSSKNYISRSYIKYQAEDSIFNIFNLYKIVE